MEDEDAAKKPFKALDEGDIALLKTYVSYNAGSSTIVFLFLIH